MTGVSTPERTEALRNKGLTDYTITVRMRFSFAYAQVNILQEVLE